MMDTNEWLLVIAGIAVVIGVFMVGWEHWEDIKKKGWRPITPKIGFAILVLGLFVETYAEIRIGQADTKFRVDATNRIGVLNKESSELRKEAANAMERAAQANERAAKAAKAAEQEKLARLEFEKEYGPRVLTDEQSDELVRFWHKYAGESVKLAAVDDPESAFLMDQLFAILRKAGLQVVETAFPPGEHINFGVLVSGSADDPALYAFADSLTCDGVFADFDELCGGPPGALPEQMRIKHCDLRIDVGPKPLGKAWKTTIEGRCRERPALIPP